MKLVLVEVLLWCSIAQTVNSNPYFVHQGEVYSEYSSWLLTYTVNVEPFSQHVGHVRELLGQFRGKIQQLHGITPVSNNTTHPNVEGPRLTRLRENMLVAIHREEGYLRVQYENIIDMIESIQVLTQTSKGRQRRAALPFVGKALSYLFGTATEGNLRQLKLALSSLRDSQAKTIHGVSESVSLVNKTQTQVRENRDAINTLINVTERLEDKVRLVHLENKRMSTELGLVELNMQLRELFRMMSRAILGVRRSVSALLHQISESANGDLSLGMIKPS